MKASDNIRERLGDMFSGFDDSMLISYFEGIYGTSLCDDVQHPQTAVIISGDFHYLAGKPSPECADDIMQLALDKPHAVFVPGSDSWFEPLNAACGGVLKKVERYHMHLGKAGFDRERLRELIAVLGCDAYKGFELCSIGEQEYAQCIASDWADSFVSNFSDYNEFKQHGFGFVIKHNAKVVSGTSTYCYYSKGVEVEVSTSPEYRKRGLARITAARFILECLDRGLAPNWDARNMASVSIARKLGFELHDTYTAYEFSQPASVHMPKDKFDTKAVEKLSGFSEEQLSPVIPELLTWIQDMNWVIAPLVCELLSQNYKIVEPHLISLLKPEQTDEIWKYNIIKYLLGSCYGCSSDEQLMNEIIRIAQHPTNSEKAELVDEAAKNFIENFA